MSFNPARIFETLDWHGVDHLTIGAWAVIAHGCGREEFGHISRTSLNLLKALVAQRIEQKTSNLLAAGSIPAEGASKLPETPEYWRECPAYVSPKGYH